MKEIKFVVTGLIPAKDPNNPNKTAYFRGIEIQGSQCDLDRETNDIVKRLESIGINTSGEDHCTIVCSHTDHAQLVSLQREKKKSHMTIHFTASPEDLAHKLGFTEVPMEVKYGIRITSPFGTYFTCREVCDETRGRRNIENLSKSLATIGWKVEPRLSSYIRLADYRKELTRIVNGE